MTELQEELESMTESQREGGTVCLSLQVGSCWLPTVQVSDLGSSLAACKLADRAGPEQGVGKEQEGATERLLREVQRLGKGAGIGRNTSEGLYQVYLGGAGPGLVSNCTLLLGSSSL